ncbi:MAG: DUF5695 domain-containing protein [Bacteroidetes bacterium]|nr:DUF5695 domain-containing protein [Bacteroidota bacterium]
MKRIFTTYYLKIKTMLFKSQINFFLLSVLSMISIASNTSANDGYRLSLSENGKFLKELIWNSEPEKNYIMKGSEGLGDFYLKFKSAGEMNSVTASDLASKVIEQNEKKVHIRYEVQSDFYMDQIFEASGESVLWDIVFSNESGEEIEILDFALPMAIGGVDKSKPAFESFKEHRSVNGNSSFCYWTGYSGRGNIFLMTVGEGTSFEYFTHERWEQTHFYLHSSTSVDRVNDTWRLPSSSAVIQGKNKKSYQMKFQLASDFDQLRDMIYEEGQINLKVAPGMTLPADLKATFSLRSKSKIDKLVAEYPDHTTLEMKEKKKEGYHLYEVKFDKLGENMVTVHYGNGKVAFLEFFVTEPLEVLIKKRSDFITNRQQIRDTTKWYDGLYSIWDMKNAELLNPDYKHDFPSFVVGGSDDPSNGKPLYVSEKNVVYPDKEEIAALEYYEKEFVWGGLQRTGDEYPYPYGIYGSENWYENRSGEIAGYNSGGRGKEKLWRTFDYTTHFAIYYNLYVIASDYPDMVSYLDAKGYLDRAYNTAMAYFEVPYNILMSGSWSFNGWTDWAYKQGNFHERYLLYIIDALESRNETEKASKLRFEWEKKVKYFIYDDPWPFGSEMFVDRTAFESSYYIGEYAKFNKMKPYEQLWYDKNKEIWYSHTSSSDSAIDAYMENQLVSNLTLRGVVEPGYHSMGTADGRLEYMNNMSGAALLDYAFNFSDDPDDYINLGYISMLSTWALMNSGNEEQGYGYWFPNKKNDGAVGWSFNIWQKGTTYFKHIPTPRGPWRYCGEIDHGLTSAVHDLATYVVDDKILGLVGYGAEVIEKEEIYEIQPKDGVRQKLRLLLKGKNVGIELSRDGFMKNESIIAGKGLDSFTFYIENRYGKPHQCSLLFENLDVGTYLVKLNGKPVNSNLKVKESNTKNTFKIEISGSHTKVEVEKRK